MRHLHAWRLSRELTFADFIPLSNVFGAYAGPAHVNLDGYGMIAFEEGLLLFNKSGRNRIGLTGAQTVPEPVRAVLGIRAS